MADSAVVPDACSYLVSLRVLCVFGLFGGVLSIVCGGLGLYFVKYAESAAQWPTQSGSGIWLGCAILAACLLGIIVSFCRMEYHRGNMKNMLTLHQLFSLGSAALAATNFSYSLTIVNEWTVHLQMWYCVGHYPFVVAMAMANIINSMFLGMLAITMVTVAFLASSRMRHQPIQEPVGLQPFSMAPPVATVAPGAMVAPGLPVQTDMPTTAYYPPPVYAPPLYEMQPTTFAQIR